MLIFGKMAILGKPKWDQSLCMMKDTAQLP